MGYTHCWENSEAFTDRQWGKIHQGARLIIRDAAKDLGVNVAREYDEWETGPELTAEHIRFNGIGENGHETFVLSRYADPFAFCKTAQKDYDPIVVAVLMWAKHVAPENFEWRSDGEPEDHKDGLELFKTATGLKICRSNCGS